FAVARGRRTGDVHADVVALYQVVGARQQEIHTRPIVAGDHIPGARDCTTNDVAGGGIADLYAVVAVAQTQCPRNVRTHVVAFDDVARRTGTGDQDAHSAVFRDDVPRTCSGTAN